MAMFYGTLRSIVERGLKPPRRRLPRRLKPALYAESRRPRALSRWVACLVVVSCVTAGSWIGSAQQSTSQDQAAWRNAWRNGEWVTHGIDPAETRYSPLDQINPANVSRLGLAWTSIAGDGGGNQEATPLFSNGVLYAITNW